MCENRPENLHSAMSRSLTNPRVIQAIHISLPDLSTARARREDPQHRVRMPFQRYDPEMKAHMQSWNAWPNDQKLHKLYIYIYKLYIFIYTFQTGKNRRKKIHYTFVHLHVYYVSKYMQIHT